MPSLKDVFSNLANRFYYNFKSYKVFTPVIKRNDINILKDLSKDDSIVICKPDKGHGIVIMNKIEYIDKVETLLSDTEKFVELTDVDPLHHTLKLQDRLNHFIRSIFKSKIISHNTKNELTVSGTHPGTLYGLPKIHKPGLPIRPILSANNTPTYNISQFLVRLLTDTFPSNHTLKNSYEFVENITNISNANSFTMASFDISSLFTNIPVNETIEIILNKLFPDNDSIFKSFNKKQFKNLLDLTIKNTNYLFNNKFYEQVDGVGMGQPCAPTLADIFLIHHESKWLNDCPPEYKPIYYKRYVDDTFLLFKDSSHITPFLNYLNNKHEKIKFTHELEHDNSLAFLDVKVTKVDNKFITGVYRKPTFTGLGTSFFSYDPIIFKINAVKTLIFRAFNLSSNFINFHTEVQFLTKFFVNNGFPKSIINNHVKAFLNKIYKPENKLTTVPKQIIYARLPYIGYLTDKLKSQISCILTSRFPHLNIRLVSSNNHSIGSFFKHKERLPLHLCSGVIYEYECESCKALYIGSTTRQLKCRAYEHLGTSVRSGNPLSVPPFSSIREHRDKSGHPFSLDNFTILSRTNHNLLVMESLYIFKKKPTLSNNSPFELSLLT